MTWKKTVLLTGIILILFIAINQINSQINDIIIFFISLSITAAILFLVWIVKLHFPQAYISTLDSKKQDKINELERRISVLEFQMEEFTQLKRYTLNLVIGGVIAALLLYILKIIGVISITLP